MKEHWENFWQKSSAPEAKSVSWSKRRVLFILEMYLADKRQVVDAGCGSGFYSAFFCDKGIKTVSLDYSESALRLTKVATSGRANLVQVDLLKQSLTELVPGKADMIFTDGLFEHFSREQQDHILRNFSSVLSERGLIITVVPNRWSPWQLIRPLMMPGIEEKPFTLQGLIDLNLRNDLTVVAQGGLNTFPFRFSPEGCVAAGLGMLLYTVAKRKRP